MNPIAMRKRKFIETLVGTARRCSQCAEPAVAWLYGADRTGNKDKSSRQPVCRKHLNEEKRDLQ